WSGQTGQAKLVSPAGSTQWQTASKDTWITMTESNKSLVESITSTLRDEILSGQYRPGERLPSERDLATRFSANRGAIRETLKKLEELGIASINPGGVRVVPVEEASLSILGPLLDLQETPDANLVCDLLEVMGSLMSMSARTAIERANDEELEQMKRIMSQIIANQPAKEKYQESWQELGTLFAQINNNLVLRLIFNGLKTQILDRREKQPEFEPRVDQRQEIENLKRLEISLSARDSKSAADAINNTFLLLIEAIQSALNPSSAGAEPQHTGSLANE
ncbi:MAG TPA: GntR family transcriptional regulator, partial [Pseudomonadales bacterium]|nr:GntR family transcriptional regulator [Pseudomonadales bacterium]